MNGIEYYNRLAKSFSSHCFRRTSIGYCRSHCAGLPIISTDQRAITESVLDGENGYIIEPKNVNEIVEKLNYLLDNPNERIEMGRNSKLFHTTRFSEKNMIKNSSIVFNHVLFVK